MTFGYSRDDIREILALLSRGKLLPRRIPSRCWTRKGVGGW
jgi:hypothetical protein